MLKLGKLCFLLILLVVNINVSLADCYDKLFNGGQDSAIFYVNIDEFDYTRNSVDGRVFEELDLKYSKKVVENLLYNKLNCSKSYISIKNEKTVCKRFPNNLVCSLDSSLGYFIFTENYVDGGYVIFNRWD